MKWGFFSVMINNEKNGDFEGYTSPVLLTIVVDIGTRRKLNEIISWLKNICYEI